MLRKLSFGAVALVALAPLWAGQLQPRKVELKGVHMCCDVCAKGCVERVLQTVDGVSDVKPDYKAKTVTFSAKDERVAAAALKALFDSGSFGTATVAGKDLAVDAPAPRKGEKTNEVTVKNVHVCCKVCVKTINNLFKGLKVEFLGDQRQKQVKISGTDLDAAEVLDRLRKAGFNGVLATPTQRKPV